jgi:hypothetical protein
MSREAMQKAFQIIGMLKPDNFVHRQLQGEAWDALRQALENPEPQVCCGDYARCGKPCTPRGRWLAEKEFTKEEQLSPVGIGVDVTPEGTHVVAVYRRSDAVEEMFYSQFHPLAKPEPKLTDAGADTNISRGLEPKGSGWVTLNQVEQELTEEGRAWGEMAKKMSRDFVEIMNAKQAPLPTDTITIAELRQTDLYRHIRAELGGELIRFKDGEWSYVRKPWVGLTDDEIFKDDAIMAANSGYGANFETLRELVKAIEAKR